MPFFLSRKVIDLLVFFSVILFKMLFTNSVRRNFPLRFMFVFDCCGRCVTMQRHYGIKCQPRYSAHQIRLIGGSVSRLLRSLTYTYKVIIIITPWTINKSWKHFHLENFTKLFGLTRIRLSFPQVMFSSTQNHVVGNLNITVIRLLLNIHKSDS